MIVLDTDIVSLHYFGHPEVVKRIQRAVPEELATTVITEVEIIGARFDFLVKAANSEELLKAQKWLDESRILIGRLRVLPVTRTSARVFDLLRENKSLRKIGRADMLIASIALAHSAILVTRNQRHFEMIPELKIENWAD